MKILEKRDCKNEEIIMSKRAYQAKIGKSYRMGQVNALIKIGKTDQEIADILNLNEFTVRRIKK